MHSWRDGVTGFYVLFAISLPSIASAHGGAKPLAATAAGTATKAPEPIALPSVDVGGYQLAGTVKQEDELEIEIRIERHIDPPDPVLGAHGPASDVEVTITLLRGGSAVAAPRKAHAESDANVYGSHLPRVDAGGYVVHVEIPRRSPRCRGRVSRAT